MAARDPYELYPRIITALDWISQGYTKTRACDECGISVSQLDHAVNTNEELAALALEATNRGYDSLADALVNVNSNHRHGSTDAKMAAVLSKNIMWYLSRRRPKEYGDRVTVEHNITADKVIIDALTRGKNRALARPVLELEYTRVALPDFSDFDDAEAAELAKLV